MNQTRHLSSQEVLLPSHLRILEPSSEECGQTGQGCPAQPPTAALPAAELTRGILFVPFRENTF